LDNLVGDTITCLQIRAPTFDALPAQKLAAARRGHFFAASVSRFGARICKQFQVSHNKLSTLAPSEQNRMLSVECQAFSFIFVCLWKAAPKRRTGPLCGCDSRTYCAEQVSNKSLRVAQLRGGTFANTSSAPAAPINIQERIDTWRTASRVAAHPSISHGNVCVFVRLLGEVYCESRLAHTRLLQHPLGTIQCTTALCNVPSLALRHEMFDKSTNFGPGLSKRPPKLFYKSPGTRFGPGFPPETLIIRIVFVGEFQTNRQTKEPKTVLGQEPKTVLDAVEALVVAKTCDVRSDLVLCMGHSVFFCLRG
jgi:hypothetical protein